MSMHEDYSREEAIEGGTDRGFGLTVGGILLAIGLVRIGLGWWSTGVATAGWFEWFLGVVGVLLVAAGLVVPSWLGPLNKAWTKLGLVLFKVVNPVVLGMIFVVTIVPIGLIMRALGKDPLRLKFDPSATSYWIERDPPGPAPETMGQQF